MKKGINYSIKVSDLLLLNDNCNVFYTDTKNRVLDCNDTQLQSFKDLIPFKNKKELIGKFLNELFPPEFVDPLLKENNLVTQTGCAHKFLNIIKFSKNKSHIYLTIKIPLYNEDNKIIGVFGISHHLSVHLSEDKEIIISPLTKREYDCLYHLLKGKTAGGIASELDLSKRSIEYYIANIKNKFNCNTKSALINKINEIGLSTLLLSKGSISRKYLPGDFICRSSDFI